MDVDHSQEMKIADDLYIRWVRIQDLKEQSLNAQVMEPRKFDTLTNNIKARGMLESLPYCYQEGGKGKIEIVSGHHRCRSALKAGITEIPVIVDTRPMSRSAIISKQIAANELTGESDKGILAQLVSRIDDAADLFATGLDMNDLPKEDAQIDVTAASLHEFLNVVELYFFDGDFQRFKAFVEEHRDKTKMLLVAPESLYEGFSDKVVEWCDENGVYSVSEMLMSLIGK